MRSEIVRTIASPDGNRRVDIFKRDDGLYGFVQLAYYREGSLTPPSSYWAPLGDWGTITDTPEAAEREARASIPWLAGDLDSDKAV